MNKESTKYIFLFAIVICVVCSLALSLVSEGLRPQKERNVAMDIKKNILKAVGLREPLSADSTVDIILSTYDEKITEIVIDTNGETVEGKTATDTLEDESLHAMYIYKEGQQVLAYAFPIIGKGLWSTLYGYFALEADAVTVRGITFYKHGETPGLGAEIEKDWFQENFKGKKIWDIKANELTPTKVIKGKVADKYSGEDAQYYVDGISGATMTSKGVTEMVDRWLNAYEPFFSKIRKLR